MLKFSYTLCLFIYTLLFAFSYITPFYKNVFFGVPCNPKNKEITKMVNSYRAFFGNLSLFLFITSVSFLYLKADLVFLSSTVTLFFIILLFKFYKSNQETEKIRLYDSKDNDEKPSYFIKIRHTHYSLHLFTLLYLFAFNKQINIPDEFKGFLTSNLITAAFICTLIPLGLLFINKAPDFANKKLKPLISNFIYLFSFTLIYGIYTFSTIILYKASVISFYTFLYFIILIFLCGIYIYYLKRMNYPYDFKIENPHISSERIIEGSLDGTRIFLNLKNKKAILITIGVALYVIFYFSLAYLFTM